MRPSRLALAISLLAEVACGSTEDLSSPDSAVVATVDAAVPVPVPDAATGGPTAYRITSIAIVDPTLWQASGEICSNISDYINLAVGSQVSGGVIDALIVFEPLTTMPGMATPAELIFGECDATHLNCSASPASIQASLTATSMDSGTCLEVIQNTIASDNPATVNIPTAPCSRATAPTATLDLAGLRLDVLDLRIGASFSAEVAPANLTKGLLYGFLTKAEAASVVVPGFGQTLDTLLRGGGSCADGPKDDRDTSLSTSDPGWYLYLTFTASRVSFVDNR